MSSNDYLRNCAHSDSVAANGFKIAVLCWSFECRTLCAYIYTLLHLDAVFLCNIESISNEAFRIWFAHIREARAELVIILSAQRMLREEVDVVCDDHNVADLEIGIHAACGI